MLRRRKNLVGQIPKGTARGSAPNQLATMSFGFRVADFLTVLKTAKGVYKACKDGPTDDQELCKETESLRCATGKLSQDAEILGLC